MLDAWVRGAPKRLTDILYTRGQLNQVLSSRPGIFFQTVRRILVIMVAGALTESDFTAFGAKGFKTVTFKGQFVQYQAKAFNGVLTV